MASIELCGVEKSFGTANIIRGVDLSIADGEFVALVGPSGCGKSTLLRIISGLESATRGDIPIPMFAVVCISRWNCSSSSSPRSRESRPKSVRVR